MRLHKIIVHCNCIKTVKVYIDKTSYDVIYCIYKIREVTP